MKTLRIIGLMVGLLAGAGSVQAQTSERFTPDWSSLSRHTPVPEWMRDAKFGIYCHWGVY